MPLNHQLLEAVAHGLWFWSGWLLAGLVFLAWRRSSWHLRRALRVCRDSRLRQFWIIAHMDQELERLRSKLRQKRRPADDGDWWKDAE